jgi:hypothetical protein
MTAPELEAVEQNARVRFGVWRKRALYSTAAFLVSCALVYPFVDGRRISAQGEVVKQGLLLLSLGLLLALLYSTLLLWGAWRALRDLESNRS